MGVSYQEAIRRLDEAVEGLFEADPRVQAVGIGSHDGGYGYRVIRNVRKLIASSATIQTLSQVNRVPVTYIDAFDEAKSLVKVPFQGPGSPGASSFVPEQQQHRHLTCGLQIQNFDSDDRQGIPQQGFIKIGTLGCFVKLINGDICILSNNHVVAGENNGQNGQDRILQPGDGAYQQGYDIGTLYDFVQLQYSPHGASVRKGTAVMNDVDAGIATLKQNIQYTQGYLSSRNLTAPSGTASPHIGDQVFKVGRTTGLTHGEIKSISTVVGPVGYDGGPCWFRHSFEIEGLNGTMFSDQGDSGSAIVKTTGEVLGLLYAGNGAQTYACPINLVLQALNISMI